MIIVVVEDQESVMSQPNPMEEGMFRWTRNRKQKLRPDQDILYQGLACVVMKTNRRTLASGESLVLEARKSNRLTIERGLCHQLRIERRTILACLYITSNDDGGRQLLQTLSEQFGHQPAFLTIPADCLFGKPERHDWPVSPEGCTCFPVFLATCIVLSNVLLRSHFAVSRLLTSA